MGRMLLHEIAEQSEVQLAGGCEAPGHPMIGTDLGLLIGTPQSGIVMSDQPEPLFASADVAIDFTHPDLLAQHLALAVRHGTGLVIGTTGIDRAQLPLIREAARDIAIFRSANMSFGVALMARMAEQLASELGPEDADIEIIEMHHRHKIDAPSGTALALAEAAAKGRRVALDSVWCKGRDGQVGPRKQGEIGISALRGGDVVGDHSVIFALDGERIEISHKASSRVIFAKGAVRAAIWLARQKPGLYGMDELLNASIYSPTH